MDSASNSTHREYTFEEGILLKPKGLVLLSVSTELSHHPPVMLKTKCAGWLFINLTQLEASGKREPSWKNRLRQSSLHAHLWDIFLVDGGCGGPRPLWAVLSMGK